ncbi:MAG TPA: hypothetical protein VHP58_01615 [Alphaproteobacteria bacterium]|nr:hypothetical protein [Alphaproteobacteria bacterium]
MSDSTQQACPYAGDVCGCTRKGGCTCYPAIILPQKPFSDVYLPPVRFDAPCDGDEPTGWHNANLHD